MVTIKHGSFKQNVMKKTERVKHEKDRYRASVPGSQYKQHAPSRRESLPKLLKLMRNHPKFQAASKLNAFGRETSEQHLTPRQAIDSDY